MKFTALFLVILSLASCQDDDDGRVACNDGLRVGEVITLPQGGVLDLVEVIYTPCPCDVMCIWQGEIGAVFLVEGRRDTLYQPGFLLPIENADPLDNLIISGVDTVAIREIRSRYACPTADNLSTLRQEDFCVAVEVR